MAYRFLFLLISYLPLHVSFPRRISSSFTIYLLCFFHLLSVSFFVCHFRQTRIFTQNGNGMRHMYRIEHVHPQIDIAKFVNKCSW